MHDLVGQSMLYDRVQQVMLGNSLELTVTDERAVIRVGAIEAGRAPETIVFRDPKIVYALLILAQVIEEQGGPGKGDESAEVILKPSHCPMCDGRGGAFDHQENWRECPECDE